MDVQGVKDRRYFISVQGVNDRIYFVSRVSKEAKIELEEDEYVERFKPFMMDIVHEWTKGASFKDIIKMTDMFEV